MTSRAKMSLAAVSAGLLLWGGVAAAEGLWIHVRVEESQGAKVAVNLPLSMIEKALPMLSEVEHHRHLDLDGRKLTVPELRSMWQELEQSPDAELVRAEDGSETVRIWKEEGFLRVQVEEAAAEERVDVRIPEAVVNALLAGEGDELDLKGAVRALAQHGSGELVAVSGSNDQVRVWIDDSVEGP